MSKVPDPYMKQKLEYIRLLNLAFHSSVNDIRSHFQKATTTTDEFNC